MNKDTFREKIPFDCFSTKTGILLVIPYDYNEQKQILEDLVLKFKNRQIAFKINQLSLNIAQSMMGVSIGTQSNSFSIKKDNSIRLLYDKVGQLNI